MDKRYSFDKEREIVKLWEDSGALEAPSGAKGEEAGKEPFCIIMPPANANDPLHVGHALFVSLEDLMIRWQRMEGKAALWLPGADHAGIETQYVFEKKLAKKGQSRFDFDRDSLFAAISEYVEDKQGVAVDQMKRLGASADWGRFKFTLDKEVVKFVKKTFKKLYADGLVYRGERLVNYCTSCGTGYSQLEVEYKEKEGKLYTISYPLVGKKGKIEVATTRPETMLGDTAIAVHPEDERYKDLVGEKVKLPLTNKEIAVVADKSVEMEFGTGAVKITPAHDMDDWKVAKRQGLKRRQVITKEGKMGKKAGEYAEMTVMEAREEIVKDLREKGFLVKITDHKHRVGRCYKCGKIIEPLPSAQFFVKVDSLVKKVLKVLGKKVEIIGPGQEKTLQHWLENLEDWNISRQIVWGIRMPVWYSVELNPEMRVVFLNSKGDLKKGRVDKLMEKYTLAEIEDGLQKLEADTKSEFVVSDKKPGDEFLQETDTFDTWFSSSQWPVVCLKNSKEGDFEYYYPTSIMETGYDILIFWVMRMLMMGLYLTDEVPFENVYLHGLVRDEKGEKMSKSKGNVIDPLDVVDKYGADALRMALVMSSAAGQDKNVGEDDIKGMRNFANKIWNAARFISMGENKDESVKGDDGFEEKLIKVVEEVDEHLRKYRLGLAAEVVYKRFWHWYCDECIEKAKQGEISFSALDKGLRVFLKLLHPFVPFVTEAVWQELEEEGLLIEQQWPRIKKDG